MYTIKTLNAISPVGLAKLNKNLFDVSAAIRCPRNRNASDIIAFK